MKMKPTIWVFASMVVSNLLFLFFGFISSGYRASINFFKSGDCSDFGVKVFGNNAHKISYIQLVT